jgi:hypothetical protein
MQLDLMDTEFFIGTKTMKFISNKKAGIIRKDWEEESFHDSFGTDNSFVSEEMDDFDEFNEAPEVSP